MEDSIEEKQKYLRQHILESGHNPDQFVEFVCNDLNVKQMNLEEWSVKKIETIVMKFQQYKYYQEEEGRQSEVKNSVSSEQKNRGSKIVYENHDIFDYQFTSTCKCVRNNSGIRQIKVFIPNFEKVETAGFIFSIGAKTEIYYIIKSNFDKQATKRLLEDFQWLSNMIFKLFPLQAVPKLIHPEKQDEKNYQKRRKQFEEYLAILSEREQIRASPLFLDFITATPEKMEKLKKNYESMTFCKGIQSQKNENGYVESILTNKMKSFYNNGKSYLRKVQPINEKISETFQKVTESLMQTTSYLDKIVDYFAQLHENYNELMNKSPEMKINEYSETLININNLFNCLSTNLSSNAKAIDTNLKEYYKITLNYDKSISKLQRDLADQEKEYLYMKSNLHRKKERIYPDVDKWEVDQTSILSRKLNKEQAFQLMLPRQTVRESEERLWVGFLFQNYKKEFLRYIRFGAERYIDKFSIFASQLLLNNTLYVQDLTKFIEQSRKIT